MPPVEVRFITDKSLVDIPDLFCEECGKKGEHHKMKKYYLEFPLMSENKFILKITNVPGYLCPNCGNTFPEEDSFKNALLQAEEEVSQRHPQWGEEIRGLYKNN